MIQFKNQKKQLQKVKEYELLKSPLSTSVQLKTSRQNVVPSSSVGYKRVHKGIQVVSKNAATYQCRELKREKSLISVGPIVSLGVVGEQCHQNTCFQSILTEFCKRFRTESEGSKELAVAEQISFCKLSQTNP